MTEWHELIANYVMFLVASGRPPATITLRRNQLGYMARSLHSPLPAVTTAALTGWFGGQSWCNETRRSYRSAARGFFGWCQREGHLADDPSRGLPPIKPDMPVAKPAPDEAWRAALARADQRTILMLRLAAEAGLRRAEVAQVHTRDLRIGPHGAQLLIHGKGSRERVVPVTEDLAILIARGAAGHTAGAPEQGWLFPGYHDGHLSAKYVGALVAAVLPTGWSMHALRHRFASRAYRGTRNLRAVQMLLGHSSIAITERYLDVNDDELRAAMNAAAEPEVAA